MNHYEPGCQWELDGNYGVVHEWFRSLEELVDFVAHQYERAFRNELLDYMSEENGKFIEIKIGKDVQYVAPSDIIQDMFEDQFLAEFDKWMVLRKQTLASQISEFFCDGNEGTFWLLEDYLGYQYACITCCEEEER